MKYRLENTKKQKDYILAASNNIIDTSKKKKKWHNINEIIYFNYNKNGQYTNNYTKAKN